MKVCGVGAGLRPQGSAERGAEMVFREGNLQGMQPNDRASSVSPRYYLKIQLNDSSATGSLRNQGPCSHFSAGRAPKLTTLRYIVILLTMSTMPLAEVKAHLSEVVSRVNGQHERVTVTVHGQASAVIMSPDDVERLEETIAVLADGELIRQLTESEADLADGRVDDLNSLAAVMRARSTGA